MKRTIGLISTMFLGLILMGCSEDTGSDPGGRDALVKFSVSGNDKVVVVGTRGDVDGNIFKIEVLDSQGEVVASFDDHTEITEGISIKGGNYTFRASTGSNGEAAFDSPYYVGTKEMNIEAGKTYDVEITCYLANVMVSVYTSDIIKENFTDLKVTVSNIEADSEGNFSASSCLEFDYDTEGDEESGVLAARGYFRATGILAYKVELTNTAGKTSIVRSVIRDVKPKHHYKLKFTIEDNGNGNGGLSLIDIVVDDELEEIEWNFVIDPDADGVPSFSGNDDYDLDEPIELDQGEEINFSLGISSSSPVHSLTVTHTSDHIATLGIPKSFNIMALEDNEAAVINEAGLTWSMSSVKTRAIHEDVYGVELKFGGLLARLPGNEYDFSVVVEDQASKKAEQKLKFVITPDEPGPGPVSSLEITPADIDAWARFANLSGRWTSDTKPEGIMLQYRAEGQESWLTITTDKLTFSGNGFKAKATYLAPATKYYVKAVQGDGAETAEVSFTTEQALQMPGMGFDEWCWGTGSGASGRTVFPNANLGDKYFWDTSNMGANTMSEKNPTTQETGFVVSGSAAKLASTNVLTVFASASLYTGAFGKVEGLSGASLDFGRPYDARPSKLKGWYSYSPGKINYAKSPYASLKNQTDFCHIWVMLTDWDSPFTVDTSSSTFIDVENDPGIIAYAEMTTNVANKDAYKEFELELVYRNDRKPKYAIIVCAASRYGDYFTGSNSSVLYVDEFEFVFDPE